MSVMILDMIAEYTDRTTGNRQIRAQLIADTVTDLPSNSTALTYLLGSYARVIDTGKEYYIDSSGTWIEQPSEISLNLSGYYTAAQTDSLLAGKQDNLTQAQLDTIDNAAATLPELVDAGAKNKLPLTLSEMQAQNTGGTWSGNAYTYNGITFTVNSDMSITVIGTLTGDRSLFRLFYNRPNSWGGQILSGCPIGGGSSTWQLIAEQNAAPWGNIATDRGSGAIISTNTATNIYCYITIVSTSPVNLTFKPMICTSADWAVSQEYVPYCPSLYELYQLVKSYHP